VCGGEDEIGEQVVLVAGGGSEVAVSGPVVVGKSLCRRLSCHMRCAYRARLAVRMRRSLGGNAVTCRGRHGELPFAAREKADSQAMEVDARRTSESLANLIRKAIDSMPLQDRMLLRANFGAELSIAETTRLVGLPQRPLYRRIPKLLGQLRCVLEREGIDAARVLATRFFRGTLAPKPETIHGFGRGSAQNFARPKSQRCE